MKKVFESERINFVEISDELIDDYLTMINDMDNVQRFIGEIREPFTYEEELNWVHTRKKDNNVIFSMIDKETNMFIGNIEFMNIEDSSAELGISITYSMQIKGYGIESIKAILNYGFTTLNLNKIYLRTKIFNNRAIHVYHKCGFKDFKMEDNHIFMEIEK